MSGVAHPQCICRTRSCLHSDLTHKDCAAQAVSTLFTVPLSKRRKQYLAELAGGLGSAASLSPQPSTPRTATSEPSNGAGPQRVAFVPHVTPDIHVALWPLMAHSGFMCINVAPGGHAGLESPAAKRRRVEPPFPARHYVATPAQLCAAEFPLLAVNASGESVPPPGFITTLPSGWHPYACIS